MKIRKIRAGNKGQTGIGIAIIGAITLVTIVLSVLLPTVTLKINIDRAAEVQYGEYNAGLTLLTLLSDKNVYKDISLNVSGLKSDIDSTLKPRLDKLVPGGCYDLFYSGGTIVKVEDCKTEFSASANIVLPYGKNSEEITLKVSKEIIPYEKYCCYNPSTLETKCETEERCKDPWVISDYTIECSEYTIDCSLP